MFAFRIRASVDERRAATRADVAFGGQATGEHWRSACRVVDLSAEGCQVEGLPPLRRGEPLRLALPGMILRAARLRWSRGSAAGCRFDLPLSLEELEILLEHSAQVAQLRRVPEPA